MRSNLPHNFNELGVSIKDYLNVHLDLVKLSMLEKVVRILVLTVSVFVIIIASTLIFIFASAAFVIWYGANYESYLPGLFIVIGFVVIITLLFYAFRRAFVESYFIKKLSSILLQDDNDND